MCGRESGHGYYESIISMVWRANEKACPRREKVGNGNVANDVTRYSMSICLKAEGIDAAYCMLSAHAAPPSNGYPGY